MTRKTLGLVKIIIASTYVARLCPSTSQEAHSHPTARCCHHSLSRCGDRPTRRWDHKPRVTSSKWEEQGPTAGGQVMESAPTAPLPDHLCRCSAAGLP